MQLARNFWQKILIGMLSGAVLGFVLSPAGAGLLPPDSALVAGSWLAIPGRVFLGLIGMVIIPLVVCSIVLGVNSSKDTGFVRDIGIRLIPYFVITTLVAVLIGIGLAVTLQPGAAGHAATALSAETARDMADSVVQGRTTDDLTVPQRIANMIPSNPLRAALQLDLLQVVIAAVIVGLAALHLRQALMAPFLSLCAAGQEICMKIIEWVMRLAPYAVFGLIADVTIRLGPRAFIGLGWYIATVLLGLLCVLILYFLATIFIGRRHPRDIFQACRTLALLAFSTSSSAAVLPVTLQTAEEKMGVHPDTARFVVPLGATINMDGTAIYQAIAAIFLCQFFGIELSLLEMFLLSLTLVGAAIGTPATPGVGIVVLATVVSALGVPPEGIGMILGVDRILDMCRTVVNVMGDLTACTIMDRWLPRRKPQAALQA